jgi:hypothetical protein
MALRQIFSKSIMPALDRDLSRAFSKEMEGVAFMVENPLASQVFGYAPSSSSSARALGRGTMARQAPAGGPTTHLVKKHYPVQTEGLMQDPQASFHHLNKSS